MLHMMPVKKVKHFITLHDFISEHYKSVEEANAIIDLTN